MFLDKQLIQYHQFFIHSCNPVKIIKMNIDKILLILIIVNIIASIKGFSDRLFFDKYKFQIGAINRGEKIRMLTSGFLHVDYLHLILNMYVLYIFAPIIILKLGVIKFLILYFGSLIAGSLLTLTYHKNELYYSAVGASGAVAGIIESDNEFNDFSIANPYSRLYFWNWLYSLFCLWNEKEIGQYWTYSTFRRGNWWLCNNIISVSRSIFK